jgi:hypothetical protein
MVSLETRIRPNDEEVIGKVMDGEAILINLATGCYYAIPDVGGLIWRAIEDHCSLAEIAGRVSDAYEVSPDRARTDVLELAGALMEQRVVAVSTEGRARGAVPPAPASRLAYSPPALSIYSDMRNLLALDPPMPTVDALGSGRGRDDGSGGAT